MSGNFAFGTKFSITVDSVLTPVAKLTSITGLELTADELDFTAHDSPNGWREYGQGLKDAGSVSIEGNFTNDASHQSLYNLFVSGDTVEMSIEFPATLATWTFEGFITGFSTSAPMEDKISFSASIKVSGEPTLA